MLDTFNFLTLEMSLFFRLVYQLIVFYLLQNTENVDSGGAAVLSDKSLKRTAEEVNSEGEDDIWDKMEVVTTSSKRKRLEKSKS